MKWFVRILVLLFVLVFIIGILLYAYLASLKPRYDGNFALNGLVDSTEVLFDDYGIPHIYAQNEHDAYFALGYAHAQERLFQMEMLRRAASGTLSEVLGADLIDVDKFFRTLGIAQHANESAKIYLSDSTKPFVKAALAYTAGINAFIDEGKLPIEFKLAGIPPSRFNPSDAYLVTGFMAFSFAAAFRTDPLMSRIEKFGNAYLADLYTGHRNDYLSNATTGTTQRQQHEPSLTSIQKIMEKLPVVPWIGSNAWVIAPQKSATGKVMLANDAHIGYSSPSVWYEAHINYPGFSFYGNHLAGFPFGVIGRNDSISWGLTMLEHDDIDFYREQMDSTNPLQYKTPDGFETLKQRKEVIKVKGQSDVVITVNETRHGPLVNNVVKELSDSLSTVSMYWVHTKQPSTLLQATYELAHAKNIDNARSAVSLIASPGVNVLYGDVNGNIAWWTAAKLLKRPKHVNPNFLLDGASNVDDPLGYYDFTQNPKSENPTNGYVFSANNEPDQLSDSTYYPGYYEPNDRAVHITHFLDSIDKVKLSDMDFLQGDVISWPHARYAKLMCSMIKPGNDVSTKAFDILKRWNGSHEVDDNGPVIYYKLLYHTLRLAMEDELDKNDFELFLSSHAFKNSIPYLLNSDTSIWWDNVTTRNLETRNEIVQQAFDISIKELTTQLGSDPLKWYWGKVHTITHTHPFAKNETMESLLNVGTAQAPGGMETIYNNGFKLNGSGEYPVTYGPSMRTVVDFSNSDSSRSVIPTGQSGYFMSKHYKDQFLMHLNCKYRAQLTNEALIRKRCNEKLVLVPMK